MKEYKNIKIIGVDHGYGNIKTAHCCFPSGVISGDKEPTFRDKLLIYNGRYYQIGVGHKEFRAEKMLDEDYYILTLAAVAEELRSVNLRAANVYLAVGLPLTWVSKQKEQFRAYLLQNREVTFSYRGTAYDIMFVDAVVYPQGFAAVCMQLDELQGTNLLADIGNGTLNVMYIKDGKPDIQQCYTEKFGTHQCMLAVKEEILRQHGVELQEELIEKIFRTGTAAIAGKYIRTVRAVATQYVERIFAKLREHGYDAESVKLILVGGGAVLIQNFGSLPIDETIVETDICAAAKGFEAMALQGLQPREEQDDK